VKKERFAARKGEQQMEGIILALALLSAINMIDRLTK
jgi:hypothetical protein